jgi:hypothetical protein
VFIATQIKIRNEIVGRNLNKHDLGGDQSDLRGKV